MAMVPASTFRPKPALPTGSALGPPRPPGEVPQGTNLLGVLLVLVADAMVLVTLLATWFLLKGGSTHWPPKGVRIPTYLPTVVTITAFMSVFSMQWAVSSIRRNDQRSATVAMVLTVVLGAAVVNAQWYSLVRAKFSIADHGYGTIYYLLIGYHAVHVALGIGALILVGSRSIVGHFGREGYDPMRAVAAFWYYSATAWSVIVLVVFLFSRHG